jgi:VWFA-related protein
VLRQLAGSTLALLLAAPAAQGWNAPDPPPVEDPQSQPAYEESIDVALATLVVRVFDSWGNPILGLAPGDFRVRVGGRDVSVVALDWIGQSGGKAPAAPAARGALPLADAGGLVTPPAPGRLVVVFVQADLNPTRISGQMRLRPFTRELLDTLRGDDRVAVVSYDSHLKLWQDFGEDPVATHAAIDEAMLYSPEHPVAPGEPLSLARHLDRDAARAAASPERALELVGRALAPLPGEKTLIVLGWGIGRFDSAGVHMTPAYAPAVRALHEANAAVFVLDVTSADGHSLETGLEDIAAATGGAYYSTFRLPEIATTTLARAISGYYVLTLDRGALGDAELGRLRVDLRKRTGTVLARPVAAPPPS